MDGLVLELVEEVVVEKHEVLAGSVVAAANGLRREEVRERGKEEEGRVCVRERDSEVRSVECVKKEGRRGEKKKGKRREIVLMLHDWHSFRRLRFSHGAGRQAGTRVA